MASWDRSVGLWDPLQTAPRGVWAGSSKLPFAAPALTIVHGHDASHTVFGQFWTTFF